MEDPIKYVEMEIQMSIDIVLLARKLYFTGLNHSRLSAVSKFSCWVVKKQESLLNVLKRTNNLWTGGFSGVVTANFKSSRDGYCM